MQGSKTIEHIKETEKEESNNEPTDAKDETDFCALASQDKTDDATSKTDNDNDVVADTKTEDNTNMEVDQVEAEKDASKTVIVENNAVSETEGSKTGMCVFYFFCLQNLHKITLILILFIFVQLAVASLESRAYVF